jgi:biopolymer transport protein ExbD
MKFQKKSLEPASFQMAPMIDIVFLLLIFFIVTGQLSKSETELDVSVPTTAEGAEPERVQGEKIINVLIDGRVIVDRTPLTQDELFVMMKKLAELYKNQPIRLRADSKTEYQHVSFATKRPQSAE